MLNVINLEKSMRYLPDPFSNRELIANDMFGEAGNELKQVNIQPYGIIHSEWYGTV